MPEEVKRKRGRPPKNKSTTATPIVETNNATSQDSPIDYEFNSYSYHHLFESIFNLSLIHI